MKSRIIGILLFATACLNGQTEPLNRQLYEAWTIEYTPYKLLIQQAVNNYNALKDSSKIVPYNLSGKVIVVVALTNPGDIYAIWYEDQTKNSFNKLNTEQVKYVFGKTLRNTLIDKTKYFNLDSRIPFERPDPAKDYAKNIYTWTNSQYMVSMLRAIINIRTDVGVTFHWGDALIGMPYQMAGNMRFGAVARYFEVGIITPPLVQFTNGAVSYQDYVRSGADTLDTQLISGFGSYGIINYQNFHLEINYAYPPTSLPKGFSKNHFSFIDYSMIGTMGFKIPKNVLNTGNNILTLKAGAYIVRAREHNRMQSTNVTDEDHELIKIGNSTWVGLDNNYKIYNSGAIIRLEGITKIPEGQQVPRIEAAVQLLTGFYATSNINYNFNSHWGLGIVYSKKIGSMAYGPEQGLFLDFRIMFNQFED